MTSLDPADLDTVLDAIARGDEVPHAAQLTVAAAVSDLSLRVAQLDQELAVVQWEREQLVRRAACAELALVNAMKRAAPSDTQDDNDILYSRSVQ